MTAEGPGEGTGAGALADLRVAPLVESACELGEGPLWRPETSELFWVDIDGQRLWRWTESEGASTRPLIAPAGALVPGPDGTLVAPMGRGFAVLDPASGAARVLADAPLLAPAGTVMNDGKCDRQGRVIGGAKDLVEAAPVAAAYSLAGGVARPFYAGVTVWNGPAFAPDGRRIYFADSPTRRILTAAYDPEAGRIAGPVEIFATLGPDEGYPDGMTVDAEGCLWNARFAGAAVARYAPDGRCLAVLALPVPRPTSVAFGGPDLDTLFVTSARVGLDATALAAAPLSGALFAARVPVTGLLEPVCTL